MSDVIVGSVGVQLVPSAEGFTPKAKSLLQGLTADVVLKPATEQFRAELEEATRARAVTVTVDADTVAAEAKLDEVARNRTANVDVNQKGIAAANSGMSGLVAAALLLAPALSPLTAVFVGITAVAGIAVKAIMDVEATQKRIDQLRKTAATTTSKKTAAAATAQADYLVKTLNGTQKGFLAAQQGLGRAFSGLMGKIGPSLFRPLTAGLNFISKLLPKLAPLIKQVSSYFAEFLGYLSQKVSDGSFDAFLTYIQQNLPSVIGFIDSLVKAIVNIGIALAPIGTLVLGSIKFLADVINAIPTPVLGALLSGILAVVAVTKAWAIAEGFLNAVLLANPVLALVAGLVAIGAAFIYAYQTSETFRNIVNSVFQYVSNAAKSFLIAFLSVIAGFVNGMAKAFGWLPFGIGAGLKNAASAVSSFRDSVNASLNGIVPSKTVTVNFRVGKIGPAGAVGPAGPKGSNLGLPGPAGAVGPKGPKTGVLDIPDFKQPVYNGGGAGGFSMPKSGGAGAKPKKAKANAAKREVKNLLTQLAQGIKTGGSQLTNVLNGILSHIADFPKKFRNQVRDIAKEALAQIAKVKKLQDAMADLAKTIKEAFLPSNLFDGTLSALRGGLTKALLNVTLAATAQKKLLAAGVSASFVAALLSSGNGKLAAQLAANPALAKDFAAQYDQVAKSAATLGTSAAGAVYNPQIDATNAELKKQTDLLTKLAPDIGKAVGHQINGAATKATTRGRRP